MNNEPFNQTVTQLTTATNILIVVASGTNLDSIAAGLALKEFLIKHAKQAQVVSPNNLSPKFSFLPDASSIDPATVISKNLVLEISLSRAELSTLSYKKQDDKLSVFISPKNGEFESSDVTIKPAVYPFDLILTLGVSNLEELGNFYASQASLFFETPVINIDYKPQNENFGQINLVNLTSSAVSEVVFDLLGEYDPDLIDEKIATLLLAGLVGQTNSFQSHKTTPAVFLKASKLVSLGARQQEIITHLYRSKSLGLLRLWGRVLARLKHIPEDNLVHSTVSASDIENSNAEPDDLDQIIFEMLEQLSFAKNFVFFAQAGEGTVCYISSTVINPMSFFSSYNPVNIANSAIKFTVGKTVPVTEAEILTALQHELAKYR